MDSLLFWSGVALLMRGVTIAILGFVLYRQFQQVKKPDLYDGERRIKRLLLHLTTLIILANFPILTLVFQRVQGISITPTETAFGTVFNAVAMLLVGVMLLLLYGDRDT